jgi:hypothetical protein
MSAATPHLGKSTRLFSWSSAGLGTVRPHAQTIRLKLQKIRPARRKRNQLATKPVAQRAPQSNRAHLTAAQPAP